MYISDIFTITIGFVFHLHPLILSKKIPQTTTLFLKNLKSLIYYPIIINCRLYITTLQDIYLEYITHKIYFFYKIILLKFKLAIIYPN